MNNYCNTRGLVLVHQIMQQEAIADVTENKTRVSQPNHWYNSN
jgi:hypothetical protein